MPEPAMEWKFGVEVSNTLVQKFLHRWVFINLGL